MRHGAVAVVSNYLLYQYEPWRTRNGLPEAVQQLRLPSRDENPWVLTISQNAFERLRELLGLDQRVVLHFDIDAKTFVGTSRSVLASIPGTESPEQSVILVAHVTAATKPGANCASGVALLLELARTLRVAIDQGRIPAPRRSVHFLFANEDLGSAALVRSRPDLRTGALAAVSVCSVGHDQSRTRSALIFGRAPDSLPTFFNDLVEGVAERLPRELGWAYRGGSKELPRLNWSMLPYTPWSDNVTWAKLGVPALLCMSLPDRYFHTQLLTVAETDPETFRFSGLTLGTAAVVSAAADAAAAAGLVRLVAAHCEARLDRIALEASDPAEARASLAYVVERDVANISAAGRLLEGAAPAERAPVEALMAALAARLRAKAAALRDELDAGTAGDQGSAVYDDSRWSGLIPRQTDNIPPHGVPGFAYPQVMELVESMRAHDPSIVPESLQLFVDEVWNLSRSGERNLATITRALGQEFGFKLTPQHIHQIAQGLERTGYLELQDVS